MERRLRLENLLLLLLTSTVVVGSYLFFHHAYYVAEKAPFAQEVLLIVLGTTVTALITALLLNKQTLVELQKEHNLRFFELKTRTFQTLLDRIEGFITGEALSRRDLIELWFITHRLAIVATPPVLEEYQRFLAIFNRVAKDGFVSSSDAELLSEALARLTVEIRRELVGELDQQLGYGAERIKALILKNEEEATALELERFQIGASEEEAKGPRP